MKILIVFTFTILLMNFAYPQNNCSFCKAVEKGNFSKVEKLFKKQITSKNHGTKYDNGQGSGIQITHQFNIDSLTRWFINKPCVVNAAWDKCQIKITIYPGWSTIGAKFKTKNEQMEKCFLLQEGTTGSINILGWRWHISKPKNKLIYKKMFSCEGFIEKQNKLCNEKFK